MASNAISISAKKPVASIIVPVYNVEKYIDKCISSILGQSISSFELIIVDDGSPDGSGSIAENYAKVDKRVKVIHQENAGVSSARNKGIEIATGEFITFVDADDYLAEDYLEYMLSLAESTAADFCLSLNCFSKRSDLRIGEDHIQVLNPVEATALLLSPRVIVGCWNKLFRRDFLINNNLCFRIDLHYGEGLQFITSVSQRANKIGVGEQRVYYYRRDNQYSATTKFNIESIKNGEKSINTIENELILREDRVDKMLLLHRSMYYVGALTKIKVNHLQKKYSNDYKRWMAYLRSHLMDIIRCKSIPLYRKFLIIGTCVSPSLMGSLDKVRRRQIANNSV